ncbi:MAG: aldose 1-epimerase family protein [Halanaerobiaceae bacterium]
MIKIAGKEYSREELQKHFGSLEQIAGIRRFTYSEGRARGVSAVEIRTGSGLRYIVLPDRGLDIGLCEYRGLPLAYRSAVGESAPDFFEPADDGWFRNFGGGLLVTCGLTYLGAPCTDQGQDLGLHGRISNIPAEKISIDREWEGDECFLRLSGQVREAKTLSTNLLLEREVGSYLGENRIFISDTVRNEGGSKTPHMILYHFNIGHPILARAAKFVASSESVKPRDEVAEKYFDSYNLYREPTPGYPDVVFYHDLIEDENGFCRAGLINEELKKGIYVKYEQKNLPRFVQWKFTGTGDYVTGLEPANCWVGGRDKERENGTLTHLKPGEEKHYKLEFGLLNSRQEIDTFVKQNGGDN